MRRQVSTPHRSCSARGVTTLPDATDCGRGLCMTVICALCRIAATPHLPKVLRPLLGVSDCLGDRLCCLELSCDASCAVPLRPLLLLLLHTRRRGCSQPRMRRQVSTPHRSCSTRGVTTLPDATDCGRGLCMTVPCALCRIAATPHLPKVLRPLPGVSGCLEDRLRYLGSPVMPAERCCCCCCCCTPGAKAAHSHACGATSVLTHSCSARDLPHLPDATSVAKG
jgi:hypothetical protein